MRGRVWEIKGSRSYLSLWLTTVKNTLHFSVLFVKKNYNLLEMNARKVLVIFFQLHVPFASH